MINSELLLKITNSDQENPNIPFIKKTALSIILRVPTTRVQNFLDGREIEDWRRYRLAEMLNLLLQTHPQDRESFINWVSKTILSNRKKSSEIRDISNAELLIKIFLVDHFKQNNNLIIKDNFKLTFKGTSICPDIVIQNNESKEAEIIEVAFSNDINNQKKKLHQLGYYLFFLEKNQLEELSHFKITGTLICSKASKQLITEANAINIRIKEIDIRIRNINF
jgi:hypothetical protein